VVGIRPEDSFSENWITKAVIASFHLQYLSLAKRGEDVIYCVSVIFVHNHPSGDTEASDDDIRLTKRLAEVGEIVGINVLDHVIIGDKSYSSLKRQGLF
jgi:hypothetical protein